MRSIKSAVCSITLLPLLYASVLWAKTAEPDYGDRKVALEVALADPVMVAGKKSTTYIKVGLKGFQLPTAEARANVNIALVIDKSGSMQGKKIEKAKQAAIEAIDRLRSNDIVSVIVYDQGVQVVLPATKLSDKATAKNAIRRINAGGSTALFAGVSKGAAEVRKFLDDNRVNRVILLSDGQANVGPDSPGELGAFGASLLKERIAVTTLGLGLDYNEDLMTQLASKSNGNHLFIEDADELIAVFDHEFRDVLSVVAQEVMIDMKVSEGIRPVRVLGHDADIHGQQVTIQLNQLYAEQERFILMEVEVPATAKDATRSIAAVKVSYANMLTNATDRLAAETSVRFSDDVRLCKTSRDNDVVEKWVLLFANEQNRLATQLRDKGEIEKARRLLLSNSRFLFSNADQLNSELLRRQFNLNKVQASNIDDGNWKKTRKLMLRDNAAVESQAPGYRYGGGGYGGGYGAKDADDRQRPRRGSGY